MCSLCTPCLPVLRKADSAGGTSKASSSTAPISANQASRNTAHAGPRPLALASSSTASEANSSGTKRHSSFSAASMRACDSSVPSPRRTTQSAECCWW